MLQTPDELGLDTDVMQELHRKYEHFPDKRLVPISVRDMWYLIGEPVWNGRAYRSHLVVETQDCDEQAKGTPQIKIAGLGWYNAQQLFDSKLSWYGLPFRVPPSLDLATWNAVSRSIMDNSGG